MNRRDAIRAVMALPAVTSIQVAQLKPRDVIVMECEHIISDHTRDYIQETVQRVWPDHKVLVLQQGLHLKVVREPS